MQPIPENLSYLLCTNVPAHVTLTRPDGSLVTHVMWVDFDGRNILTSSPVTSYKSRALRARPQVSISVVDPRDPWRRLSVSGHVTDIRPDEGLAFINKMSQRYTGGPYQRPGAREVFTIEPDRVRAFEGRGAVTGGR
jgi:PPOX class probable F420-dependent enzyme